MSESEENTGGGAPISSDPAYDALSDLLTLLQDADLAAELVLDANPSPEERRQLDDQRDEIARKIAVVEGRLLAMIHQSQPVPMPDDATVKEIATLCAEAERLTNKAVAAAGAVDLATRALALAQRALV